MARRRYNTFYRFNDLVDFIPNIEIEFPIHFSGLQVRPDQIDESESFWNIDEDWLYETPEVLPSKSEELITQQPKNPT